MYIRLFCQDQDQDSRSQDQDQDSELQDQDQDFGFQDQDQDQDFLVKTKARLYSDDHWTDYHTFLQ